ncbi:uncharacterized protein LOC130780646 [Actinidia eriantha]|uniref:uncharacterized protein LOC130780646 n=1 Tax=Actinidia eriantha TaxID=165200 RepID=UPI002584AE2D|nr:uncharacterized protein LOC130780646 [Actinidia eriantha]
MANLNDNVDVTVAAASTQKIGGSTTPAACKIFARGGSYAVRSGERSYDRDSSASMEARELPMRELYSEQFDKMLYNVYSPLPTVKLLWDSLDKKYKVEDASAKKFLIGQFLDFKMVDSKKVMAQVQDFQLILHELAAEGIALVEEFQVGVIIEKLPPSWRDFINYLKHKRKGMSLEDLIVRLRIEEDNRLNDRKGGYHMESKANVRKFKKKQPARAHLTEVEQVIDDILDLDLCAVVSEINLVGSNPRQWWVDIGATRNVCCDRELFSSFKETLNGEQLYMGNSSSSKEVGQGTVILKMTSEKQLTLNNVLYMPDIRKNLVSGSLLVKHGFKLVFESDKLVILKNGVYIRKGYVFDGLFKINCIVPNVSKMNKNDTPSAYLLESSYL